ncbi:carboxymuconolactone decarboxylase family protein [Chitinophaga pinensis]|uniref:Carboxymuconolactone decarboxylase family protein n=1 Tax=Chitinophaga pinensis TaxID=79329 RepID=A0A5C6LRR3_9BACT|nr:hypothetical protein [Chitinophaga pinensis]TWV99581.1 hypothetical protein FEF09_15305 [Chitinophaga pinensis]
MARINPLSPEETPVPLQAAYSLHTTTWNACITNMKATLGHSQTAFEVYMEWYRLYDRIKRFLGLRPAYLFAYTVSVGSNCPLCTTFFRKIIIDHGEDPAHIVFSEKEQLLMDFGSAIAQHQGRVNEALFAAISAVYNTEELVELIAFAGQMIATNIFNNVIETDIDEYLFNYLPLTQK